MASEMQVTPFRGTDIEKRYMYYWYVAQRELLEQDRAQMKMAENITHPEMHSFGIATLFGGVLGAKYPMLPRHLVELGRDVERIKHIDKMCERIPNPDCYVHKKNGDVDWTRLRPEKDRKGLPLTIPDTDPNNRDGMRLLEPYIIRLKTKFSIMEYRAFRATPIRKWLKMPEQPEDAPKQSGGFAQLLKRAQGGTSEPATTDVSE